MKTISIVKSIIMLAFASLFAAAQPPPGGPPHSPGSFRAGPPPPFERGGFGRGMRGRWWMDPSVVQRVGISNDQQTSIESIFQQSRVKLIDLSAALQKEEALLEPLLEVERPDEAKVVAQIDRVAQARGELEKANARMLLSFRGVLTADQWKKLQTRPRPEPPGERHGAPE